MRRRQLEQVVLEAYGCCPYFTGVINTLFSGATATVITNDMASKEPMVWLQAPQGDEAGIFLSLAVGSGPGTFGHRIKGEQRH